LKEVVDKTCEQPLWGKEHAKVNHFIGSSVSDQKRKNAMKRGTKDCVNECKLLHLPFSSEHEMRFKTIPKRKVAFKILFKQIGLMKQSWKKTTGSLYTIKNLKI
jgi:secreted Zn-dependent insulinase-like peptidase